MSQVKQPIKEVLLVLLIVICENNTPIILFPINRHICI